MPRRISLGGPGTLITEDADPLEVALKQAQLEELLQKPQNERAQIALAQQQEGRLRDTAISARQFETFKGELAKQQAIEAGDIDRAKLLEEQTRTKDTRAYQQGSLGEETRYHKATVEEQGKGREAAALSAKEATRAGVLKDTMGLFLPGEQAGSVPAGTVGGLLEKSGYPELNQAYSEAAGRRTLQQAKAMLPEYQKYTPEQRTKELAAQPEEFQTAMSKLLGQPAGTAAVPGAAPTATPTPTVTPKPPPSTTTIPIGKTSGLSFNNRPIPIELGFSSGAKPTPSPAATPPPAVGVPLTELLKRRRRRGQV